MMSYVIKKKSRRNLYHLLLQKEKNPKVTDIAYFLPKSFKLFFQIIWPAVSFIPVKNVKIFLSSNNYFVLYICI